MPETKTMKVLMCKPDFFDVEYEINPWMHKDSQVDRNLAKEQWENLYNIYTEKLGWDVELIKPEDGLPDMVFTANGGLVYRGKVVLPHFRHVDRQPETEFFKEWFQTHGLEDALMPRYDFEGEGDALLWNDTLFAGYPWRSDKAVHAELADFLGVKIVSVQLADARFYHLDTCLTIVDSETVALWPKAFTEESLKKLREAVPNVIEADEKDTLVYGLNAMSDGKNIVVPEGANGLIQTYQARGMNVFPTPITEFQKSGGGVKCLTLELRS